MKKKKINIGLIDYGMGNLHSVAKAFEENNASVIVSNSKGRLKDTDLIVLPGVGAFGAAMKNLAKNKLDDFVFNWISTSRPYVGICLGFQLLFERSEENPGAKGLGIFKGEVKKFNFPRTLKLSVPHMGWNSVDVLKPGQKLFGKKLKDERFYFVHSYYAKPKDESLIATTSTYGVSFCSSVAQKNLFACQFHPEKSSDGGLALLKSIQSQMEIQ